MKKHQLIFQQLSILIFGILLFLSSCSRFEDPPRDKFLGGYVLELICGGDSDIFEVSILPLGSDENAVTIITYEDTIEPLFNLAATVSGNDITITPTELDGETYSGNGTLNGNVLTIDFVITDAMGSGNCTFIATRFD